MNKDEEKINLKNAKMKETRIERENNLYIKEFLSYLAFEKGNSSNTIAGYERDLRIFSKYVNKNLTEVTEEDIYSYIREINDKLKKNSVLRKVATIRNFYKFCYLNKINEKGKKTTGGSFA